MEVDRLFNHFILMSIPLMNNELIDPEIKFQPKQIRKDTTYLIYLRTICPINHYFNYNYQYNLCGQNWPSLHVLGNSMLVLMRRAWVDALVYSPWQQLYFFLQDAIISNNYIYKILGLRVILNWQCLKFAKNTPNCTNSPLAPMRSVCSNLQSLATTIFCT